MANTIVTVRPNATTDDGGWSVVGAGSVHAALSDDSDATYITATTATAGTSVTIEFATTVVPPLARIISVTPRVRCSQAAGSDVMTVQIRNPGVVDSMVASSSVTTITGQARTTGPSGGAWTQTDINALRIFLAMQTADSTDDTKVYEVYLDVVYNQAPNVAIITPSGSVTSAQPTVAWSFVDPESDAQERYRVKVFSDAQYGMAGFSPETSTSTWDSTETFSSSASASVGVPLPAGIYQAYVKASDVGSAGRYSAWAFSGFIIAGDPPQHPIITAVAQSASVSVLLSVQGQDNILTTDEADFETSAASYIAVNATVGRTLATAAHGIASLTVTSSGAGTARAASLTGVNARPVTAGTQYTGLVSVKAATVARSFRAVIAWYTAAGALISEDQGVSVAGSITGFVQALIQGVTAPPHAVFAAVAADIFSTAGAGEVHYLDIPSIAPGNGVNWTRGGLIPQQRFTIERSDDGGATWRYVRGAGTGSSSLPSLLNPQTSSITDYEAPLNTVLQYRAYTVSTDGSVVVRSDTLTPVTAIITATSAQLKDPNDPTLNRAVCLVSAPLVSTSSQPQQVFSGLGDPNWSVSSDVAKGEAGDVTLSFDGDVDFAAFEALRDPPRTLLLQTGYGDHGSEQMYVRLGPDRTMTRLPTKADGMQARIVTVGYRQVQEPV